MKAIKKIGIVGCGTIGQKVAVELDKGSVPGASLKAMSSRNLEKVRVFAGTLGSPPAVLELKDLVPIVDIVIEAATIAVDDGDGGIMVKAFLKVAGDKRPSIIEMTRFCSENLPQYMIPDRFSFLPSLPKTSTDKIDYQSLEDLD